MRKNLLLLISTAVVVITSPIYAQAPASETVLEVKAQRNPKLSTGTQKIYTITVSFKGKKNTSPFHVAYDLDETYRKEFNNQTIPFSFEDNFSGLTPGIHVVKIDLDDADNKVVFTQSIVLQLE